jgi:hypothetical protein|tara:strand:- start:119 stop:937 length:819 start_codon:yes stop_codon:yes gene_type:complete
MNTVVKDYNFLKPFNCDDLIRLGNNFDGGYVVSREIIKNSDALVSFGYNYEPSFEYDYIKESPSPVFIYDYSCSSRKLIGRLLESSLKFILNMRIRRERPKFYFNTLITHLTFIKNKKVNFFKKKVIGNFLENKAKLFEPTITIDKIFKEINFKKIIFKCDIEGSEYEIIDEFIKYQDRIGLAVIEFHNLDRDLKEFNEGVKKILKYFTIVHIHGNNNSTLLKHINIPCVPEITFINNKYIKEKRSGNKNFPIESLDYPNKISEDDLFFNFI